MSDEYDEEAEFARILGTSSANASAASASASSSGASTTQSSTTDSLPSFPVVPTHSVTVEGGANSAAATTTAAATAGKAKTKKVAVPA
jgi:hypothetical protein